MEMCQSVLRYQIITNKINVQVDFLIVMHEVNLCISNYYFCNSL